MIKLITYDLMKPGQSYTDLHSAIRDLGSSWWHRLESVWLVDTSLSADQIVSRLKPCLIDTNDYVLVMTVGKDYQGWLPKDAWPWIDQRLSN